MKRLGYIVLAFILTASFNAAGQATYYMHSDSVDDCEGILFDSDAGATAGHYDHGEDYTFIICVPGATSIDITWSSFCTEAGYDTVYVYDGPDTLSPLIGKYSGTGTPPASSSSSGCITIYFRSDASVSCDGWEMHWTVNNPPPDRITILPIPDVNCYSDSVLIRLSGLVDCDSVSAFTYTMTGPSGTPAITSATPAPCTGDSTDAILLTFSGPVTSGCTYTIIWEYGIVDVCDNYWPLSDTVTFEVPDCPIEVEIWGDTIICEGDCTWIYAYAEGGDCTSYTYAWTPSLPATAGWHMICPATDTTYRVIVDDASSAVADTAYIHITVVSVPVAGPDTAVCDYDPPFAMTGTPPGGYWTGPGIIDSLAGIFDPGTAGAGVHTVYYMIGDCYDSAEVTVYHIDAGPDEAACPGASPFILTGGTPPGGTWAGPGIIDPVTGEWDPGIGMGTYVVTYSALGCVDSKTIIVDNIILQPEDTICESDPPYFLTYSPFGGIWTGPGIIHPDSGIIDPSLAGPGAHRYYYDIHGCRDSVDIYVFGINAGSNFTACPFQDTITLSGYSPPGGYWTGPGIVDSFGGRYDPGWSGANRNDYLVYHSPQGCTDTIIVYVRNTTVGVDSLFFCPEDTFVYLDWPTTLRNPWDGVWTGTGVTSASFPGTFDPGVSGSGTFVLTYTANTCSDSLVVLVYDPPTLPPDTTVCAGSPPFYMTASPPGGYWSGRGISDTARGRFSPGWAGLGTHTIYYTSPAGCTDSMYITVDPLPVVNLAGLAGGYCFEDTLYQMIGTPPGGTYWGPGVVDSSFNPSIAGPGIHYVYYTVGTYPCDVTDSARVIVGDTLKVDTKFDIDSICYGEDIEIAVIPIGGLGYPGYSYLWSHGLSNDSSHIVRPDTTTTYMVIVTDGCSDPDTAWITVYVHPPILPTYELNDSVCYGDSGWARIIMPPGSYSYLWSNGSTSDYVEGIATTYNVVIRDLNTGCFIEEMVEFPHWPFINARFEENPSGICVDAQNPTFDFIDLSVGGTTGYWDFGDGVTEPYVPGVNPSHTYPQNAGEYTVTLYIENEGGCPSTYQITVCVNGESVLWVPNAFSPNNDGINDEFIVSAFGIENFHMMIFNRWGEKVYESDDITVGWDGTYRGEEVKTDVYTYLIEYTDIFLGIPAYKKGFVVIVK